MNVATSFKILGIGNKPDLDELKKAYRVMAKKCHPDRFPNDPVVRKRAESRMKEINLAFKIALDFVRSIEKVKKKHFTHDNNEYHKDNYNGNKSETSDKSDISDRHDNTDRHEESDSERNETYLSRFFSWLKNAASINKRGNKSRYDISENENKTQQNGKDEVETNNIVTKNKNKQQYNFIRKQEEKAKKHYKFDPNSNYSNSNFDDLLKKSTEALINSNKKSANPDEQQDSLDSAKGKYSRRSQLLYSKSSFRYLKRRQKFMDSYSGPVESITPISRTKKIS